MDLPDVPMDRLRAFFAVVETGGFTAAGLRLKIGKNAVSQQVSKLERDLGVSLFTRTTRLVVPTEEGRRLYQTCEPLLRDLQSALENVGAERLSGELRITAPADYADLVLCPALTEFGRLHPQLRIALITNSRVLDLVGERIDLSVRLGWPRDSSLRAVKVGEFSLHVVTTDAYLASFGAPDDPRQLAGHSWVELSTLSNSPWRFTNRLGEAANVRLRARFSANTAEGVLALVRSGAGVAVATDFSVAHDLRSGSLVRILEDWRLPRAGIYLAWPNAAHESPRQRALVDFLRTRLSQNGRAGGDSGRLRTPPRARSAPIPTGRGPGSCS